MLLNSRMGPFRFLFIINFLTFIVCMPKSHAKTIPRRNIIYNDVNSTIYNIYIDYDYDGEPFFISLIIVFKSPLFNPSHSTTNLLLF